MAPEQKHPPVRAFSGTTPPIQYLCPRCGDPMIEADRLTEAGGTYYWYRCRRFGCCGCWLHKIHTQPLGQSPRCERA